MSGNEVVDGDGDSARAIKRRRGDAGRGHGGGVVTEQVPLTTLTGHTDCVAAVVWAGELA